MSDERTSARSGYFKLLFGTVLLAGLLGIFLAISATANAGGEAKVTVNSTANVDDGHCEGPPNDDHLGNCTLREAINMANEGDADIINFHPAVFAKAQPGVINICEDGSHGLGELPPIIVDVDIESKDTGVIIDGGSEDDGCGDPADNGILAEAKMNGMDFTLNGGKNFVVRNLGCDSAIAGIGVSGFEGPGDFSLGTIDITGVTVENACDDAVLIEGLNLEQGSVTNSDLISTEGAGIEVGIDACEDGCELNDSMLDISGNRIQGGIGFPVCCDPDNGVNIEYTGVLGSKITASVSGNEYISGTAEGVEFTFAGCGQDSGVNVHVDDNQQINGGVYDAVDVSIFADQCLKVGGAAVAGEEEIPVVEVTPGHTSESFEGVVTVNGNGDMESSGLDGSAYGEGVTVNVFTGFEESDSSASVEVNDNGRISGEDDGVGVTTWICCGDNNSTQTNVDRNDEITGEGDDGISVHSFAGSSTAASQANGPSDADGNECTITVDGNNEIDGVGTDTGHGTGTSLNCFAGALGFGGIRGLGGQPQAAGEPTASGDENTSTISVINNSNIDGDWDAIDIEGWSGSIDGEADDNLFTAVVSGNGEITGDNDDGVDIDIAAGTPVEEGDHNNAEMTIEENASVAGNGGHGMDLDVFAGGITEGSEDDHTSATVVQNGDIKGQEDGINMDSSVCCDAANTNTIDFHNNKGEIVGHDSDGIEVDTCCSVNYISVMDNAGNIRGGDDAGFELDVCDDLLDIFGIGLPPKFPGPGGNPVGFNDCLKRDITDLQIQNNSFSDSEGDGINIDSGTFEDEDLGIKSVISNNVVSGNGEDGIDINSANGLNIGPANEIYLNGTESVDNGIEIDWWDAACAWDEDGQKFPANHNHITQNSIYDNYGLGIDLVGFDAGGDNFACGDVPLGEGDVGCVPFPDTQIAPNDCIPFPQLKTQSDNKLIGMACTLCEVEIFWADDNPDNNFHHGEGVEYLVSTQADEDGNWSVQLPCDLGPGDLTATATDKLKNTSEFSENLSTLGTFCPTDTPTPTNTPVPPTNTPTATNTPVPAKQCGDVNDDGVTNSIDATLVLQLKAALVDSLPNEPSGDVNGDGRLSALDASLILQYSASLIGLDGLHCP